MITIFSVPKAFRAQIGVIQHNAIKSWTLLHPDIEIILFGDDSGTAEISKKFDIRHEPEVLKNEYGRIVLNHVFNRAQKIARYDLLCYVNCDIILMSDFAKAVERVSCWSKDFLMVGCRWNVDFAEPIDFARLDWESRLRDFVLQHGRSGGPGAIDYFVFYRGMYTDTPSFGIGGNYWDNWKIWKARSLKKRVIDASKQVMAIHQNHDYSFSEGGDKGFQLNVKRNCRLSGGMRHLYSIKDATHELTSKEIKYKFWHIISPLKSIFLDRFGLIWFPLLKITRPIRHRIGLNL